MLTKMMTMMMKLSLMMMIIDVNSAPPLVVDEDVTAFSFVRIGKRSHRDLSTLVTIRLRAAKDFANSTLSSESTP